MPWRTESRLKSDLDLDRSFQAFGFVISVPRLARQAKDVLGRGTSFVIAGNIVVNLARIVSTVALTRLLTAEDFGVVGIVSSILYIAVMLSDVGFQAYVVRHDEGEQASFLDEVWTLRLIRGAVIAAAIALLSAPLAHLFGKPALQLVFAVSGAYLALDAFTSLAFATAARSGMIRRLTLLDVIPHLLSIPLSIALAYRWRSYWAIIAAMFFVAALKIFLSYAMFPDAGRRWRLSGERARDLWAFGRYIAGSSIIQILLSQIDKVVLARLFPLSQFGLYSLATNLAQVPAQVTGNYSSRILYPLFARTQRDGPARISDVYYGSGRPLRLLYMLAAGGFIACAPLIIELLYDDRYLGAVPYLQLLAIVALFSLPVSIASDALIAVGGVRHFLRLNLVRVAWLGIAGPGLYAWHGPIGFVVAVVSMQAVGQFYCWWALGQARILRPIKEFAFLLTAALGYVAGSTINAVGTGLVS
ncbi:oligosaccharide flippase family protein [Sphingomonas mesophila]|uniref:oligosaccharide flippase family protein n=1 Tax=Sphingomonas mesophila TaxID=2303576 RepID=UPI0019679DAC|nr:oligosaccharide flippase family protein [Sphingomonas mesophila]